ncbi:MAG: hypothetical protein JW925_09200 [Syntrophaceae bacterium]|nr:hypothetical protein [Syntrophaceae bacterium]
MMISAIKAHRPLTIVFAMLSYEGDAGHYNGSFKLARSLRASGHRIFYIGLADSAQLVKDQGFEFISFAEDLLPLGYEKKNAVSQSTPGNRVIRKWRKRCNDERLFKEYLRRIVDGRLDERLLSCNPDLLICDIFLSFVAMRALYVGIPVITINPLLSVYRNPYIPPIWSSFTPRRTWWSAVIVLGSWHWLRFKFLFWDRLVRPLTGEFRSPTGIWGHWGLFLRIAKRSGYPCEENKTYRFAAWGPYLILPEIVCGPKAFQLPGSPEDGRRYMSSVDFSRDEKPFDAGCLDEKKPLIYCSLGSIPLSYSHSQRFFKAVIDASRLRRGWQFVLNVGKQYDSSHLGSPESNLMICQWVPQLSLLKKASVMVTHGGLNSIMECINFGVPMVIMPGLWDQQGNAVRAVHHGIALKTNMARITPEILIKFVERALEDENMRQSLATMKQKIAAEEDMEKIIRFIENTCTASFKL